MQTKAVVESALTPALSDLMGSCAAVAVQNESATTAEAVEVLMERLLASKIARLLSYWQIWQGDYLKVREKLFGSETVESLYQAARKRRV